MAKHIYNLTLSGLALVFFLLSRLFHRWYLDTPYGSSEEALADTFTDAMIVGFVATLVLLAVSVSIQALTYFQRRAHDEKE